MEAHHQPQEQQGPTDGKEIKHFFAHFKRGPDNLDFPLPDSADYLFSLQIHEVK